MNLRALLLLVLLLGSLAGCDQSDNMIEQEREVYGALIDFWSEQESKKITVLSVSAPIESEHMANHINNFSYIETNLDSVKKSLSSINKIQTTLPLPKRENLLVLPESEHKKIFGDLERPLSKRWEKFYKLHPKSLSVVSISRVGLNKSATKALVYYHSACGPLCGKGYMVYFERGFLGWRVVWLQDLWVS